MSDDHAEIDDWLEGRMTPPQRARFAARLASEPVLRDRVVRSAVFDAALGQALADDRATVSQRRRIRHGPAGRRTARRRPRRMAAVLLVVAVLAVGAGVWWGGQRDERTEPQPGVVTGDQPERLAAGDSIRLPDGSRLTAHAPTAWDWSEGVVVLRSGAITIVGEHTEAAGLTVETGVGSATAIGTEFSVFAHPDATTARVASGRVRARSGSSIRMLAAGDGVVLRGDDRRAIGTLAFLCRPDALDGLSWFGAQGSREGIPALLSRARVPQSDDGWQPDQEIIVWREDGSPLATATAGRLRLRLHAQRPGRLTVTVSLHRPQVEDEHNYLDLELQRGWQSIDLALADALPGPEARRADGRALAALGLYSHDAGEVALALATIDEPR